MCGGGTGLGFLTGGAAGTIVGAVTDVVKGVKQQKKDVQAQTQAMIDQQDKLTQDIISQQNDAVAQERTRADKRIADTLGRERRNPTGGGGNRRGTLLTGGQGISTNQLNLGKTLLGQ